jgi:hypothetical protein
MRKPVTGSCVTTSRFSTSWNKPHGEKHVSSNHEIDVLLLPSEWYEELGVDG